MTDYSEVSDVDFILVMRRATRNTNSREFCEVMTEAKRRGRARIEAANRHYVVDESLKTEVEP